MNEKLEFIDLNKRNYFIHSHFPSQSNKKTILFFNPIFDEKKRVQKFQSEIARAFCCLGYSVFRFDYYGTGDSGGETFEFDINKVNSDFPYLIDYVNKAVLSEEIILFGIRLGADLALINSLTYPQIKNILLVDPIIQGKRFLLEIRTRKKLFYSLNKIKLNDGSIVIQGQKYEDFQGYPMSYENLAYLEKMDLCNINVLDKYITIFKTNSISSKKLVVKFEEEIKAKGKSSVGIQYSNCNEFWSLLEMIDTSSLTQQIITFFREN